MNERVSGRSALRVSDAQGIEMLQPDEVATMVQLSALGWGAKRLAREFGCGRNTVRRYLRACGPVACAKRRRATAFDGLEAWLRERFSATAATPMSCARNSPPLRPHAGEAPGD
jgi:hypothetical protein